jgi:hypothetical protein
MMQTEVNAKHKDEIRHNRTDRQEMKKGGLQEQQQHPNGEEKQKESHGKTASVDGAQRSILCRAVVRRDD